VKCICLKGVFGAPRRWGSQLLQCVLRSLPPCRWCLASVAMHTALPGCPASLGEDGGDERIRFCWFQSKGMRFRYKQRERESSRSFEYVESAKMTLSNPCKMFITWGENKRPDFYHFVPQGGQPATSVMSRCPTGHVMHQAWWLQFGPFSLVGALKRQGGWLSKPPLVSETKRS